LKQLRPAFTIIEILISVIIISFAIIFVLKIHSDNHEQIVYISERNKLTLQDSLYLGSNILEHHEDNKTAYDVMGMFFKIKELKSREILKQNSRDVFIPDDIKIMPPQEQQAPTVIINEVMLKGMHSSIYYHLKIQPL
jgi:hypothetical protein